MFEHFGGEVPTPHVFRDGGDGRDRDLPDPDEKPDDEVAAIRDEV